MSDPLVTVSMPYYGCPETIRRAVLAVLAQTMPDFRLVVVNDGESAGVWGAIADIEDPRLVRFDLPENRGRYFCDAVVLAATRSEWFAVHDADDAAEPGWLATMLELASHIRPPRDWVSTAQSVEAADGTWVTEKPKVSIPRATLVHYAHMAGLYRTEWLREVAGGVHPAYRVGYDSLLSMIARQFGNGVNIATPLYNRFRRAGSLTDAPETGMRSKYRRQERAKLVDLWRRIRNTDVPAEVIRAEASQLWAEVNTQADWLYRLTHADRPIETVELPFEVVEVRAHAFEIVADGRPWDRPWALDRAAAAELDRHLAETRPATIVEFGSGASTLVLAAHAARTGAHVLVLEHDRKYFDQTRDLLKAHKLYPHVALLHAPLTTPTSTAAGGLVVGPFGPRYDHGGIMPDEIDFALVDGPPEGAGGRRQIIDDLWLTLAENGEVWLDDADRSGESAAINGWLMSDPLMAIATRHRWGGRSVARLRKLRPDTNGPSLPNSVALTILAGGRPMLLTRTLNGIDDMMTRGAAVVLNQADERSMCVLDGYSDIRAIEPDEFGVRTIGEGVAACAALALDSGRPYWLHLEDDWLADTADPDWLGRAVRVLATRPEVAQVRLRHVGERVLGYHMITRKPIRWTPDAELGITTGEAHWTFNPSLCRTRDIAPLFAMGVKSERHAQQVVMSRGPKVIAQLYPGVFRHIGGDDSLADKTGGR